MTRQPAIRGRLVALLGVAGLATPGLAQQPLTPFPTGTAVGRPLLMNVGQQLPKAAPNAGTAIGYVGPDGQPINAQRPPGQVIDLSNLAAPITAPLDPGLEPRPKSVFEQIYEKWRAAIGLSKPADLSTNYTPGLSRRNRERRAAWWRYD